MGSHLGECSHYIDDAERGQRDDDGSIYIERGRLAQELVGHDPKQLECLQEQQQTVQHDRQAQPETWNVRNYSVSLLRFQDHLPDRPFLSISLTRTAERTAEQQRLK